MIYILIQYVLFIFCFLIKFDFYILISLKVIIMQLHQKMTLSYSRPMVMIGTSFSTLQKMTPSYSRPMVMIGASFGRLQPRIKKNLLALAAIPIVSCVNFPTKSTSIVLCVVRLLNTSPHLQSLPVLNAFLGFQLMRNIRIFCLCFLHEWCIFFFSLIDSGLPFLLVYWICCGIVTHSIVFPLGYFLKLIGFLKLFNTWLKKTIWESRNWVMGPWKMCIFAPGKMNSMENWHQWLQVVCWLLFLFDAQQLGKTKFLKRFLCIRAKGLSKDNITLLNCKTSCLENIY